MQTLEVLVGFTVGLAGFLLFLVEPMMGKYILPWFGGSASTWSVCLLFFQSALLVGYFYVFAVSIRLPLRVQAFFQLALLAGATLLMPIAVADSWKPDDASSPGLRILAMLTASVGLPFAVLATTSPLLQRWVSLVNPKKRVTRYYAVSNLGSFLGLISFPFLVEPSFSSPQQTIGWSFAFGGYAVCFAACAIAVFLMEGRAKTASAEIESFASDVATDSGALAAGDRGTVTARWDIFAWIGWATGGAVLLLATTNLISEWISVVPFLWVLPLALYLLTFVLVFSSLSYYRRELYLPVFIVLSIGSLFVGRPLGTLALLVQITLLCVCMFTGCMICHGELVARTPVARRLPGFYLAISFGGFLGGLLVAFVAPAIFPDIWEYQIAILSIAGSTLLMETKKQGHIKRPLPKPVLYGMSVLLVLLMVGYVTREITDYGSVIWRARNFYGVVKVTDDHNPVLTRRMITMWHSGGNQGETYFDRELRSQPACDFGEYSGLGLAQRYVAAGRDRNPIRIGIIGLGIGHTLAYAKPGDTVRYYELNPAVVEAASQVFSFIKDTKATVDIVLGDGRLSLERELKAPDFQKFDVLVLDAFRGVSPPMHLLTKEAFEMYLSALKPEGIFVFDTASWIANFSPLHRGLSEALNIPAGLFISEKMVDDCDGGVDWVLYTRDQAFWKIKRVARNRADWSDHSDRKVVWTDKNTNLLSVITWKSASAKLLQEWGYH